MLRFNRTRLIKRVGTGVRHLWTTHVTFALCLTVNTSSQMGVSESHKVRANYLGRTLLAGVNQIICANWPRIPPLPRAGAARSVKQSHIKDKSFLVFTILSLTTLPAICEVPQTHLLHPGLVMAFLNVHVGLRLSQGEGGCYRPVIPGSSTRRTAPCIPLA